MVAQLTQHIGAKDLQLDANVYVERALDGEVDRSKRQLATARDQIHRLGNHMKEQADALGRVEESERG